jgi:hypothetical protein
VPARLPVTGTLAALGLIGGFAVAVASGSRPLGGVVLVVFAVPCVWLWLRRDGRQTAIRLSVCGVAAFALSHALGLVIGAWPAVLVVSAAMALICWRWSDRHHLVEPAASARPGAGRASA